MTHRVVSDYTPLDSSSTNIKVYIRARPPEEKVESDFLVVSLFTFHFNKKNYIFYFYFISCTV